MVEESSKLRLQKNMQTGLGEIREHYIFQVVEKLSS